MSVSVRTVEPFDARDLDDDIALGRWRRFGRMAPRWGRCASSWRWGSATVVIAVLGACLPLLTTRDFYLWDDSEIGAFGLWYRLGELLRSGVWPLLQPSLWMSGNVAAEGQWGLWNPVSLVIGLLASLSTNALTFTTGLKIVFLGVAALGGFVLARSYRVRLPLAFAAGVALPFNGFTMYMDAPSWITGLVVWSLLPFAWAALRAMTNSGRSPLPFCLVAYLIVSVGYVHGTLALCLVMLAVGIDQAALRRRRGLVVVALSWLFVTFIAITVYLPQLLTAEVTTRSSQLVTNDGGFTAQFSDLLTSGVPTTMFAVRGWWGDFTTTPILYAFWFLPVLAFVSWRLVRPHLAELRDVFVVLAVATLAVIGPSDAGPLRYPMRFMPYVTLGLLMVVVVLIDRSLASPPRRPQLWAALAFTSVAGFLGYSRRPGELGGILFISLAVLALGLLTVWLVLKRVEVAGDRRTALRLGAVLAVGSVLGLAAQLHLYPTSPSDHFDLPGPVAEYRTQLPGAVNDTIVVGAWTSYHDVRTRTRFAAENDVPLPSRVVDPWDETLIGNAWLINNPHVQNAYSIIQHAAYGRTLCMNHRGETCPELLDRLFRTQPQVFTPLVDLLSVDTVHILKAVVPETDWAGPPSGWSVLREGPQTVTWTRDRPVGPAGGVVWSSAGTRVTELERTDRTVRLRVDGVPEGGGRVVFSRLAWPGYHVDGASLALPVNDYLLAVDVGSARQGQEVVVSFDPPGWAVVRISWVLGLTLAGGWVLTHALRRRRRSSDLRPQDQLAGP